MPTFYRGNFSQLWVTLRSDEVLGELSGDYLEDYFGNAGQVSLVLPDNTRVPLLMSEVVSDTPEIPHDSFTGVVELSGLANGHYAIQGRVRDVIGNYTIIGAVENPFGSERVISLEFDIVPGFGVMVMFGALKLTGAISFTVKFTRPIFSVPLTTEINF